MEFGAHLNWLKEDRLDRLKTRRAAKASAGADIIDLSMINPDLPPPRVLMDRLMEASMKVDNHRYAISRGVRRLREAFAHKYDNAFSASLDPETEVCVTMGAKDAVVEALQSLACPGEFILLGAPHYPAYLSSIKVAQLEPIFFNIQPDYQSMLSEIIGILRRQPIRILLLNFPNNPTGITVPKEFYRELLSEAKDRGCFVINDFAYGEMGFNQPAVSILSIPGAHAVAAEIYTMSKAYNIPGWRLGAFVGNPEAVKQVVRFKSHIDYGIFLPMQYAAAAALTSKEDLVSQTMQTYRRRLQVLSSLISQSGFVTEIPSAGASLWASIPEGFAENNFAETLLEKSDTLVMPGELFGESFSRYIRLAAVTSEERLREVGERFKRLITDHAE